MRIVAVVPVASGRASGAEVAVGKRWGNGKSGAFRASGNDSNGRSGPIQSLRGCEKMGTAFFHNL
jgi:hypothetical protein